MLQSNWLAFLLTALISVAWLRIVDFFAHRGLLEARLSRKIIHIGTGPIFVLCWLLFNDRAEARYLAAGIPLLITIQFALIGLGVIKDQASVDAMSRTGNPHEILKGPLYYGLVFVALTILFWKPSPVGIAALMMMCGGDGMADLVGRRFGRTRLPWSREKSVVGTLSVFIFGLTLSLLVFFIFSLVDSRYPPLADQLLPVTMIALAAAAVESLPVRNIDNITVPAVATLVGLLAFNLTPLT